MKVWKRSSAVALALAMVLTILPGFAAAAEGGFSTFAGTSCSAGQHGIMILHKNPPSTCSVQGIKDYWSCSSCGLNFQEEAAIHEIFDLNQWLNDLDDSNHEGPITYLNREPEGHLGFCESCYGLTSEDLTPHVWTGKTGLCVECGYACPHSDPGFYAYEALGADGHRRFCTICGAIISGLEAHTSPDGICGVCAYDPNVVQVQPVTVSITSAVQNEQTFQLTWLVDGKGLAASDISGAVVTADGKDADVTISNISGNAAPFLFTGTFVMPSSVASNDDLSIRLTPSLKPDAAARFVVGSADAIVAYAKPKAPTLSVSSTAYSRVSDSLTLRWTVRPAPTIDPVEFTISLDVPNHPLRFQASTAAGAEIPVSGSDGRYTAVLPLSGKVPVGQYNLTVSMPGGALVEDHFTVPANTASSASTVETVARVADTVTANSSVADLQKEVLAAVPASDSAKTEEKIDTLRDLMGADSETSRDLNHGVEKLENSVKEAKNLSVSIRQGRGTDVAVTSAVGLALNEPASENTEKIILTIDAAAKPRDNPPASTASELFSVNVSGLKDPEDLGFPVQFTIQTTGFDSSKEIYALHYPPNGEAEPIPAFFDRANNVVITTSGFSDFLVYQTSNGQPGAGGSENGSSSVVGNLTLTTGGHGTLDATPRAPERGQTVTLTLSPNRGYDPVRVRVTGKHGQTISATKKSTTEYTFVMPNGPVAAIVEYAPTNDADAAPSLFNDVTADHTFYKEIVWAAQKGLMSGYGSGDFQPRNTVTRQQLWMVLGRVAGASPADMAAAKTWAMENGISDGSNPTGAMSRQQLVTMLHRYAASKGLTGTPAKGLEGYTDHRDVSSYAAEPMAWAVESGIIGGTSAGLLDPAGTATRGQFAAILFRFVNKNLNP